MGETRGRGLYSDSSRLGAGSSEQNLRQAFRVLFMVTQKGREQASQGRGPTSSLSQVRSYCPSGAKPLSVRSCLYG